MWSSARSDGVNPEDQRVSVAGLLTGGASHLGEPEAIEALRPGERGSPTMTAVRECDVGSSLGTGHRVGSARGPTGAPRRCGPHGAWQTIGACAAAVASLATGVPA